MWKDSLLWPQLNDFLCSLSVWLMLFLWRREVFKCFGFKMPNTMWIEFQFYPVS